MSERATKKLRIEKIDARERKKGVRTAAVPPVGFLGPMLLDAARRGDDGALRKRREGGKGGRGWIGRMICFALSCRWWQ